MATKAPIKVIPDRAFIPDINGVCKSDGTLRISKYPTTVDTAKTINKIPCNQVMIRAYACWAMASSVPW